jgi:hypothetical protein
MKNEEGIKLNSRGIPARKKKKNSLIYGAEDLVSIPVKSPKKRVVQKPAREPEKSKKEIKTRLKKFEDEDEDLFEDDEELEEQENMADSIDKSINFYEDNIDEPDSPVPIKTPKEVTNTLEYQIVILILPR